MTASGVETPSQADADSFSVQIEGSPVVLEAEAVQFFPDSLIVELPQLVEQQPVEIEMYVNVVQSPYHFKAFVGNTQNPELWQPVDPDADVRFSTTVFLPDVVSSDRLIANFSVQPVFTPNGDGVGDEAKIRFNILKVDMPGPGSDLHLGRQLGAPTKRTASARRVMALYLVRSGP